ncbi:histone chaperone Rttp106-like-domain-containing protein [Lyophyllum atratum]|nr:histone chaperone Rttp106-like-domain-containing protein [Lyophyllum atratum]
MASETPFLRAILPSLPSDVAKKVRTLCGSTSESEYILDTLIRFISGAECAPNSTTDVRAHWNEKQQAATQILTGMTRRPTPETKRPREEDGSETDSKASKRQRSSAQDSASSSTSQATSDEPLFTIHSVSATSPVRKKVDITIHKTTLTISHPTTHAIEATIPLSSLTRAFLLPTRGKQKAHWTIVLLSSDTPDRGKPATTTASNPQVIFGIDAVTSTPLTLTVYDRSAKTPSVVTKGSPTRPTLLDFLSRLGTPLIEPEPDVFKSVCTGITSGVSANEDGVPGIEAYRGAKPGSLWFTRAGILWGESKPCEFWALEDLIGKSEGLRVVGATGRTCTVVLTRKSGEEVAEGEEDMGVETEFGMVDAKERTGIDAWVRTFRALFGKKVVGEGKVIGADEDDSDEEDEDFEMDSDEDLDGSESSSNTSDEEEGGGSEKDAEESDEEGQESGQEEELKEENHPLLRPGAMPRRMNRAVIDMVVGMVEEDMMGTVDAPESLTDGDEEEPEEDELED